MEAAADGVQSRRFNTASDQWNSVQSRAGCQRKKLRTPREAGDDPLHPRCRSRAPAGSRDCSADAGRASARARIADEVPHVGAVLAFDHAHAAIHRAAAASPAAPSAVRTKQVLVHSQTLPAISSSPCSFAPKAPNGRGSSSTRALFRLSLALVARKPAARRIVVVDRQAIVPIAAARRVGPLLVGRQPVGLAGPARQPGRVGVGIAPAHLHGRDGRPRSRRRRAAPRHAPVGDAALIVGAR